MRDLTGKAMGRATPKEIEDALEECWQAGRGAHTAIATIVSMGVPAWDAPQIVAEKYRAPDPGPDSGSFPFTWNRLVLALKRVVGAA